MVRINYFCLCEVNHLKHKLVLVAVLVSEGSGTSRTPVRHK